MTDCRVFIVEDEAIVADDIAQTLKSLGYRIAGTAHSGEIAIEKICEITPDIVLMDIHLSGRIDGIQTAGEIHQRCDVPIIYLTAYADEALLNRAKLTARINISSSSTNELSPLLRWPDKLPLDKNRRAKDAQSLPRNSKNGSLSARPLSSSIRFPPLFIDTIPALY
jgi:CheY-like chemotaxis protein